MMVPCDMLASATDLSTAIGRVLASAVAGHRRTGRSVRLVVPGGNTPAAVFDPMPDHALRTMMPWEHTEVFFTDERCVAATHPDSNYGRCARTLLHKLARIGSPPAAVHRIHGEEEPGAAAAAYATLLASSSTPSEYGKTAPEHRESGTANPPIGPSGKRTDGRSDVETGHRAHPGLPTPAPTFRDDEDGPIADVALLGVGPDGHVASLFPGFEALRARPLVVATPPAPRPPHVSRITLTLAALRRIDTVVIAIVGPDKAPVLRRWLADPAGTAAAGLPIAMVAGRRQTLAFALV